MEFTEWEEFFCDLSLKEKLLVQNEINRNLKQQADIHGWDVSQIPPPKKPE